LTTGLVVEHVKMLHDVMRSEEN